MAVVMSLGYDKKLSLSKKTIADISQLAERNLALTLMEMFRTSSECGNSAGETLCTSVGNSNKLVGLSLTKAFAKIARKIRIVALL